MTPAPFTTSYWPADTSEPVMEVTVGGLLREAAGEAPDRVALVAGTPDPEQRRRWTYAELLADAERAARALAAAGMGSGERLAVWGPNLPEWVILELGAALAGVVLVTVNPALRAPELAHVLGQSRSAGLFLVPELRGNPMAASLDQVRPELPELRSVWRLDRWDEFMQGAGPAREGRGREPEPAAVQPRDPAQIQYTSGTTGLPKGALLSHRGIVNNARLCARRMEVGAGDVWLDPMPLFHTGGCVLGVLGALWSRATHVLVPGFDPGLVLELVESEGAAVLGGVPTMLMALMEHPRFPATDLSSLRAVLCGGATVPADLVRRIEGGLGVRFGIVFGQTESSPVITQTRLDDSAEDKAETIGQPLPRTEVKIVDPAGETVAPGVVGELCTRGYLVMDGYFEAPEATALAIDAGGWLHTGDLCSMDDRGYFKVEGRLKDMIIRGGENLYPREIEAAILAHPGVADVAVVGAPDPRWGEQVAAFVRPVAGAGAPPTGADLAAFVADRLAPHKVPRHWVMVAEYPMTASGKVQKHLLRGHFLANPSSVVDV